MTVDADITEYRAKADGKAYFFCSQGCLEKFQADPSQSVFGPL
ncbi:copper/silver-translocating P-type ATPase [Aurantimonas sp. 22II-16-19i]|nr:copper/silver-translocating P-type ATPase [Aurantimonas sp. 22II-16-19i]